MIIKMTYDELAEALAEKLTDSMSEEDLAGFFWEYHYDYYRKYAQAEDLINEAFALGIIENPEDLELMEG